MLFICFSYTANAAVDISVVGTQDANNLNIGGAAGSESSNARENDKLQDFNENDQFIEVTTA